MSERNASRSALESGDALSTILLSQRDLGLRVPLNFVTYPGVSLSAACFSHRSYEDDDFVKCLSNLLAVGFRRLEVDVYWDEARRVWSLCPVEFPIVVASPNLSSNSTAESSAIFGSITSRVEPTASSDENESESSNVNSRQLSGDESASPTTTSPRSSTSLGTALPSASDDPKIPNAPSVNLGPFVCTSTMNLDSLASQILDFITDTQNTLGARLLYIIFNMHASSSSTMMSQPALRPSSLPSPDEMIGSQISSNLSDYLYTPTHLFEERLDLNDSWYSVDGKYEPLNGYYSTEFGENRILSTEDGWPSEAYMEFSKSKRLLLGWGRVDPQMQGYNFSGDASIVFGGGYLTSSQDRVVASAEGQVTNGCFLRDGAVDLSQANSSWASISSLAGFKYPTTSLSDLTPLLSLTNSLTNCGISPILNQTLLNTTASHNPIPYFSFTNATIWSWALNEPLRTSTNPNLKTTNRCASTSLLTGRWSVTDCTTSLHAACRVPSQPYNWTLSSRSTTYSSASSACPKPYAFAVPRTALENAFLTQRAREEDNGRMERVWLDFNALDADECWVSGGAKATCPYSNVLEREEMNRRTLLVALIAAIIVLAITALTTFVMCAGNRKVSRRSRHRKRQADDGVFYEGVPS